MRCTAVPTPAGLLQLFADDLALRRIAFPAEEGCFSAAAPASDEHPLLCRAKMQLTEYFNGQRQVFDLPLAPDGTVFQQAVWTQIAMIPCGETRSYGEIAVRLGDAKKARAVGGAAGKNPLPIVIPCHRVVGGSGRLTGFSGGLAIKRLLLALERGAEQKKGINFFKLIP